MVVSALRQSPQSTLFSGINGKGACILPGGFGGGTVLAVVNNATTGNESGSFEKTLTKDGQIQQTSSSNLSQNEYWCVWFQ
jgi:hypothetical protein